MATQDAATKEKIMAALKEVNITDLDSLAEFMVNKRASLKTVEEDRLNTVEDPTIQGDFVGKNYVYTGAIS